MCQRVTCPACRKPTFVGCGRHVEQVLGDVPPEGRCKCSETKGEKPGSFVSVIGRLFSGK